jgi:phenylacetic acid degradation operon negative regulatory protein
MRPTAKSFVVDLLSTLGGRSMPVRALIAAAALFGIEENALRVALTRLLAAGTLERDDWGEYRLGQKAQAVQQQVVSWRRLEERVRPWRGGWIGIHTSGLARAEARRCRRAIRFFGFRELVPGFDLRPDNLSLALGELHRELLSLGVPSATAVFAVTDLDETSAVRARSLWDTRELVNEYRRSCAELAQSEARLAELPIGKAMVESFLLGGRVIRQLVLDPLLPEPIVDVGERRALLAAMRRYDKVGHACWRAFFNEYRITSVRAPVDSKAHGAPQAA